MPTEEVEDRGASVSFWEAVDDLAYLLVNLAGRLQWRLRRRQRKPGLLSRITRRLDERHPSLLANRRHPSVPYNSEEPTSEVINGGKRLPHPPRGVPGILHGFRGALVILQFGLCEALQAWRQSRYKNLEVDRDRSP